MIKTLVKKLCVKLLNEMEGDYTYNNEKNINYTNPLQDRERRRKELAQTISKHIVLKKC